MDWQTVAAIAALPALALAGYVTWWSFGPGAMERRKDVRKRRWLRLHLGQLERNTERAEAYKQRPAGAPVDREAM